MKAILTIVILILSLGINAQTPEELEMAKLINEIRNNPKSFIPYVENFIAKQTLKINMRFDSTKMKVNISKTKHCVNANANGIGEAKALIVFLTKQSPIKSLDFNSMLYPSVKVHAVYLDSIKAVSNDKMHFDANGIAFISKHISIKSENCAKADTMKDAILYLMMEVGHRNNIMDKDAKEVSIAKSGNYWVQDFTGK
jgi:hypothetical protein